MLLGAPAEPGAPIIPKPLPVTHSVPDLSFFFQCPECREKSVRFFAFWHHMDYTRAQIKGGTSNEKHNSFPSAYNRADTETSMLGAGA